MPVDTWNADHAFTAYDYLRPALRHIQPGALTYSLPGPAFIGQLSVEGFLKSKQRGGGLKLLTNPLSSEFGVTSYHDVEQLIVDELSSFKLVRTCYLYGTQRYRAVPR